jgi:hypothetical protein
MNVWCFPISTREATSHDYQRKWLSIYILTEFTEGDSALSPHFSSQSRLLVALIVVVVVVKTDAKDDTTGITTQTFVSYTTPVALNPCVEVSMTGYVVDFLLVSLLSQKTLHMTRTVLFARQTT